MAGRLTVWELLTQSWPLSWPIERLRDDIGQKAIEEADQLGLIRWVALQAGKNFLCPRHCQMELVEDDEGLVAICGRVGENCPDRVISPANAWLAEIDSIMLTRLLQRLLRLNETPPEDSRVILPLGARKVGTQFVRFVLVPRPQLLTGWIERMVREDPIRVLVMITFTAGQLPSHSPRRIEDTRVEWVALEASLGGRFLDLSPLWLSLGSAAAMASELWPRYAFVVDEAREFYAYAGVRLPLDRQTLEAQLLQLLLRNAGRWVSRQEMMIALWPEAFGGGRSPNLDALDGRLRHAKKQLSAVFKGLERVEGSESEPVETLRSRNDTEGGYRINVDPERVFFVG